MTLLVAVVVMSAVGLVSVGSTVAETAAGPAASPAALPQLALPEPTGPHPIGTVSVHLVDHSRADPWVADRPARELMVQLWYPAWPVAGYSRAPWLSPSVARMVLSGAAYSAPMVRLPISHGHVDAPVQSASGPRPLVLYSHGAGADRGASTALVEDLASHGYVVATIDHTYDAWQVEFPGRRVENRRGGSGADPAKTVAVHQADSRFVLDQLAKLNAGTKIDTDSPQLPTGLRGALDLSRVGMLGWSLGGATAAAAMHADSRIRAGVNLDGSLYGPVLATGLDRPFLIIGTSGQPDEPSWAALWSHQRGWRLELRIIGAAHSSFTDLQALLRQQPLGQSPEWIAVGIGSINPTRSVLAQRTYIRAFFDQHLLGQPNALLADPSPAWPEIQFVR